MKRYALIAMMLAGCMSPVEQFRGAAPSTAMTSLNVPGASTMAAASSERGPVDPQLIGQRATMFEITRGVVAIVNGGVGVTLLVLESIVAQQPTSMTATHATWGPYTGALDTITWKFDVEKTGTIDYSYVLSGKPRNGSDTQYQAVIAGTAHVVSQTVGSGDFLFDFAALHILDANNKAQGGVAVHYDNTGSPRVVTVAFKGYDDGNGSYTPDGALYKYSENADKSGEFDFIAKGNADKDPQHLAETLAIKSVWLSTGQGRSTAAASGGGLSAAATLEECWNGSFQRTYFIDSWNAADTEGDPASCKP